MESPLIRQMFGIDLRALAAFRIGLGVMMLANLATRIPQFVAHYTDAGSFPRSMPAASGLYNLSGGVAWPAFLFVVTALVSLALLLGYRTWLATVLTWIMLVFLHQRNPNLLNAGDHVLALLLFWSMFLPLGARASVDSRAAKPYLSLKGSFLSVATVAILFQLFAIYFFSALLKSYFYWVVTGEALYYALQLDYMIQPLGEWLADSALPDRFFTRATWWYELLGVFVAFIPWRNAMFRSLTVLGFVTFHLTLILSFKIMLFPYICIVAWMIYLPPSFWDAVGRNVSFRAIHRNWDALLRSVAVRVDKLQSAHRSWPLWPVDFKAGTLKQALAGAMLLYVVWGNVSQVSSVPMPAAVEWLGGQAYLKQRWGMFAPQPGKDDGWWLVAATLDDGSQAELFSGSQPIDWSRPAALRDTYPTERWRKKLSQGWSVEKHRPIIAPFGDWLRRRWDANHETKVVSLTVFYMLERTQQEPKPPIRRDVPVYTWSVEAGGELMDYTSTRRAWNKPPVANPLVR